MDPDRKFARVGSESSGCWWSEACWLERLEFLGSDANAGAGKKRKEKKRKERKKKKKKKKKKRGGAALMVRSRGAALEKKKKKKRGGAALMVRSRGAALEKKKKKKRGGAALMMRSRGAALEIKKRKGNFLDGLGRTDSIRFDSTQFFDFRLVFGFFNRFSVRFLTVFALKY
ncbi:hypothetical protein JCGZ_09477 [Jatropha curcas]|uniref:Uncharacterized protein n=1 Tax=Jatropha curcas TaxID=180498 RepID=A0A067KK08_JATCU|nr:hypothetical protein JCGZ_09477 [Jatropha curcas]